MWRRIATAVSGIQTGRQGAAHVAIHLLWTACLSWRHVLDDTNTLTHAQRCYVICSTHMRSHLHVQHDSAEWLFVCTPTIACITLGCAQRACSLQHHQHQHSSSPVFYRQLERSPCWSQQLSYPLPCACVTLVPARLFFWATAQSRLMCLGSSHALCAPHDLHVVKVLTPFPHPHRHHNSLPAVHVHTQKGACQCVWPRSVCLEFSCMNAAVPPSQCLCCCCVFCRHELLLPHRICALVASYLASRHPVVMRVCACVLVCVHILSLPLSLSLFLSASAPWVTVSVAFSCLVNSNCWHSFHMLRTCATVGLSSVTLLACVRNVSQGGLTRFTGRAQLIVHACMPSTCWSWGRSSNTEVWLLCHTFTLLDQHLIDICDVLLALSSSP